MSQSRWIALPQYRTWLIAAAAALWGVDGLLRQPFGRQLPAATIVWPNRPWP